MKDKFIVDDKKTYELINQLITLNIVPPKKMTVSEWAELIEFYLLKDPAEPGKWSNKRAPYQKYIMDAFTDKETEK